MLEPIKENPKEIIQVSRAALGSQRGKSLTAISAPFKVAKPTKEPLGPEEREV